MFCSMNLSLLNVTVASIVSAYFGGSLFAFYGTIALGVIVVASLAVVGAVAYKKHKGKSKRKKFGANKENGQAQAKDSTQNQQQDQTKSSEKSQSKGKVFEDAREKELKEQSKAKKADANTKGTPEPEVKEEEVKETKKVEEPKPQPVIKKVEKTQPATTKNNSSAWVLNSPFEGGKEL